MEEVLVLKNRARDYEVNGLFIMAQDIYDHCVEILTKPYQTGEEQSIQRFCRRQSENIDAKSMQLLEHSKRLEYRQIAENSTGNNYDNLFGKYFDKTTREILIKDPYIHQHFQFQNLIRLFELAISRCPNLVYIRLITTKDRNKDNIEQQQKSFEQITKNLLKYQIHLKVKYDAKHDRIIMLNNDFLYTITIQRGLDIYKALEFKYAIGLVDYNYRKCRETEVSICRSKNDYCGGECTIL